MAMNDTIKTVGMPSASGYPGSIFQGLQSPVYVEQFIERLYANTISGLITDTGVVPSELRSSGDLAIIPRAPRGNIRKLTKNQELEHDRFNSDTVTFKVDKAWYWNLKIDKIDVKQIKNLGKWIKAFQDDCIQQLGQQIDHDLMQDIIEGAHMCNKGNAAGVRSKAYKLGQLGAPVDLQANGATTPLILTGRMMAVLGEQNAPLRGRYVVWPEVVSCLFLSNATLANAYASGEARSTLLSGSIPKVMGVDHHFSQYTPVYDEGGTPAYPVIFGVKEATGYVNQMTESETVMQDSRHFGQFWRGMNVAGWGVIRPELLGCAYVIVTQP